MIINALSHAHAAEMYKVCSCEFHIELLMWSYLHSNMKYLSSSS